MFQKISFHVQGVVPTILHNGQLANPLNEWAIKLKEISKKKNKTEADYKAMAKIEWYGSLYVDDEGQPCWPGECIEALIRSGAKKTKRGKDVQCGLFSDGNWAIIHDGPKDIDALYETGKFTSAMLCKVGMAKIVRTRPMFREWSVKFDVDFDAEVLNKKDVVEFVETAGRYIGLSDYRPKFGRYEVLESKNGA